MNFHILSLFPEMVLGGLATSITGRAMKQGKLNIEAVDIRDFSKDRNKRVDDYTYGGGAGMLMQAQPVYDAWESVAKKIAQNSVTKTFPGDCSKKVRTIYVTPQGTPFSQAMAEDFAKEEELVILCGHYEGIDERVLEEIVTDYVSIGDYVLTGGELAAMVIVDAVSRLVPGVLHNEVSAETESFHGNLLEYPQYSRPSVWHEKEVPAILLTGNQKEIDKWRREQAVLRTRQRRPDLFRTYCRLEKIKEALCTEKLLHTDMIAAIDRGSAKVVFWKKEEILLYDLQTDIYYHTNLSQSSRQSFLQGFVMEENDVLSKHPCNCLVLHQQKFVKRAELLFELKKTMSCNQVVYTRHEKAPVSGLYRPDGKCMPNGLVIKQLTKEHAKLVSEAYLTMDKEYVEERILSGAMIGAFVEEKMLGFCGNHNDGEIGMLYVYPDYRRQKVAKALVTYLINQKLDTGQVPFGQIVDTNESSRKLAEGLGMYTSKTQLYWLEKKENA